MSEEIEKRGVGQPTKYREHYPEEAEKLCLLGATSEMLATFFEVSRQTIYTWMERHEEFAMAVKRGKLVADMEVANSLYQRALEGDVKACTLWLANRHPELWNYKRQIVVSGDEENPLRLRVGRMSDDELVEKAKQITNRLAAIKGNGSNG